MPINRQICNRTHRITSNFNPNLPNFTHFLTQFYSTIKSPDELNPIYTTESPDLPSWVHNSSMDDLKDDFFLPKLANWADTHKVNDQKNDVKVMVGEIIDSDLTRLTRVLMGKFDSVDGVVKLIDSCGDLDLNEDFVGKILKRFSNDWVVAYGFFVWGKSKLGFVHSKDCYDLMIDILGKAKKFGLMWDLVEEMNGLGDALVSNVTISKVIRRLAKVGNFDDAIDTFKGSGRFGLRKEVSLLNVLMDALVKEGSVEHAQKVFLELKEEISPNLSTFNVLIHGWCKARKFDEARKVMEEMEKQGFRPDSVSYTCFIEAYCRDKDFRKVDGIMEEMDRNRCPPSIVTYTIVMLALGKAKETNEALGVYEKMKKSGLVPDSGFYSALIFVLNKSGRFKDAREVFEDMSKQNVTPDVLAYNTMISAACMHSREEDALDLLLAMEKKSCQPDVRTYAPLLKMCCKKQRMKVLKYLLNDMYKKNVGIDFGTYTLLVHGLCKSGKLEHACSFFDEFVSKGFIPNENTYMLLKEKLEEKGMEREKQKVEKLMSRAKTSQREPHCDDAPLSDNNGPVNQRSSCQGRVQESTMYVALPL